MKALTLTQPWATLVVRGIKRFETRSWSYNPVRMLAADPPLGSPNRYDYVGQLPIPLAIHAGKAFGVRELAYTRWLRDALDVDISEDLPTGAIVGTVTYVTFHWSYPETRAELAPSHLELELGDWSDGRILWELADPVEFDEPIPWLGRQRLWNYPGPLPDAVAQR